jgi:hypothetical protein
MAWTNVQTLVIGGVTYIHQRGDQVVDLGHRLTADAVAGDAAPLNRLAQSGTVRAALPEFDLADQSGLLTAGIFDTAAAGGGTTAGVLDLVVTNVNTITADGAVQGASVGYAINGPAGYPVAQSVSFANAGGLNPTTAGYIDVGGGASIAQVAAKLKAAIDLGAAKLAGLINTAIATTGTPNNTVRITAVGLGAANSPRAFSLSDGLTINMTAGT